MRGLFALLLMALAGAAQAASDGAIERFSEAVRIRTVSPQDPADFDPSAFVAFHAFLERAYPRTHATLEREVVAGYSLLYTWPGSDASLAPILLTSHIDVVPIVPGSEARWTHPAFDGVVADGFLWGRGTLDDKVGVMATLEAVESLVEGGFAPARTVYLAFGHDEELGGNAGAGGITALLESRGVRLFMSLDEGMAISEDMAGTQGQVAMIGVAEKGFLTLELVATAPGGHSSMPGTESAIGSLARAVTRLEENPMPARLEGITGDMLDALSPQLPFTSRLAISQRWLLGGLLVSGLSASPETNALVRTTTAVTMIDAGTKANVLPSNATATANFRIHPSDRSEAIVERVRELVTEEGIEVRVVEAREASAVSRTDSAAYGALVETIREVYGDIPVAPALVLGGTDTKHYGRIAEDSYRFTPVRLRAEDARRLHGIDERIALDVYEKMPDFYAALLRRTAR
jgi:carboxypeptidase PM20D1